MLLNPSQFCEGCVQCEVGERRVETDGLGTNGILVVGESPWKDEVKEGKPFAGASGRLLDKVFRGIGVRRESFLIGNSGIWCRPPQLSWIDNPKRFPDAALALSQCRPHLDSLVARYKPKVIVPLGNVALERICGVSGIESRQAYVHDSMYTNDGFPIPAVPTFHPSYVMQGKHKLINAVSFAFRRAIEVSQQSPNGVYTRYTTEYYTDVDISKLKHVLSEAAQAEAVAVDIETPRSSKLRKGEDGEDDPSYTIVRVGISWQKGKALSIPYKEEYHDVLKEFFAQTKTVDGREHVWVLWNKSFDVPRLAAAGTPLCGTQHDAMWAWHFLQSNLPKALDFVAPFFTDLEYWAAKADSDPAYYNATDCDATLRIYEGVKEALQKQNRWDVWLRHCVEAGRQFEVMGSKGIKLDVEAQARLKVMLEEDYKLSYTKLQDTVPDAVKPLKTWKKQPKSIAGCTSEIKSCPECVEALPSFEYKKLKNGQCARCHDLRRITVWRRRGEFNPSSSQQVAKLIRAFKLKMPKKRGEDRETTEAKYLRRFGKKHRVFRDVLDCRKRAKLISAYLWVPNAEGRITTSYGFHPSTWRKSSRNVNLMVIPKRYNTPREKEVVQQIKKTLTAEEGHVLVEADSTSIEAVLVGYWAGDADYIKLAKAGVHGYLMSDVLGERIDAKLPFEELQIACKAMKSRDEMLYDTCKRTVHGSNYGLTPFGMCDEFEENFATVKIAKEFQDRYFGLFPKIVEWMRATRERVSKEHYLDNHYGYRHYFYDVFQYDWRRKVWTLGEDGKRVVAFGPQSDASAIQTEDVLEMSTRIGPTLRLIIHDSIVAECRREHLDTVAWEIQRIMTRPRPELGGLEIGAEVKWGMSLGEMKEWVPSENVEKERGRLSSHSVVQAGLL